MGGLKTIYRISIMSLRNKFVNIVETVVFGATSGVWDVVKIDRIMTMENYRELCMVVFLL